MYINAMRGRVTSSAVDENRFTIYSPEWYFARYCQFAVTDLNREVPIKFGLTLADALAYVDRMSGWNGTLEDLKYDWALGAHRAMHWGASQIGVVYSFSPVTVDILMQFMQQFGIEEVSELIERKARQLNYFRGLPEGKGHLHEVVNSLVKALSKTQASVLFHNVVYSAAIDRAVELKANAQFLSKLIISKNTSDAVVRSYSEN